MIEKNILHPRCSLFEAIEENIITIKKFWERKDLLSKNDIAHLMKKIFYNF